MNVGSAQPELKDDEVIFAICQPSIAFSATKNTLFLSVRRKYVFTEAVFVLQQKSKKSVRSTIAACTHGTMASASPAYVHAIIIFQQRVSYILFKAARNDNQHPVEERRQQIFRKPL
jgi:hypothetical protein